MSQCIDRRRLLSSGVAGIFGVPLASLLQSVAVASAGSAEARRALILIWLDGGPSTIDMWDPRPEAPDEIRGEFKAISTSVPGVMFGEHLPQMAAKMDCCTLIRSLQHTIPEHGPGAQYMLTGHLPSPAIAWPSLGSVTARMSDDEGAIPSCMAFNNPAAGGAGYLGAGWKAFELESAEESLPPGLSLSPDQNAEQFRRRLALRDVFDRRLDDLEPDATAVGLRRFQKNAVRTLEEDALRKAIDLETEEQSTRERYGRRSSLGQDVLRARRLVEAGSRFVTVGFDGWDTHTNNFAQLRNTLLPQLDAALSALLTDLQDRGRLDSTAVCCVGEFGRTPAVNGQAGRDHWSRCFSVMLAGAGLRPGVVHGATDRNGREPVSDPCSPQDLFATLLNILGIDHQATLLTPAGRPMPLVKDGVPIAGILR